MNRRFRDFLLAALALGVAAISIYLAFGSRSQRIDLGPYDVLGAVAAEETAKLVSNRGQVLLIIPDTGGDKNPSVEAELKAFQQALRKQGGLTLRTQRVPVTPMLMLATGGGVPPDQLLQTLETQTNLSALVLFFRFPQLNDGQLQRLSQKAIKTVVVSSFYPDYQELLDRGVIQVAIVPRLDGPVPGSREAKTLRERFDQEFTIIAAAEASHK